MPNTFSGSGSLSGVGSFTADIPPINIVMWNSSATTNSPITAYTFTDGTGFGSPLASSPTFTDFAVDAYNDISPSNLAVSYAQAYVTNPGAQFYSYRYSTSGVGTAYTTIRPLTTGNPSYGTGLTSSDFNSAGNRIAISGSGTNSVSNPRRVFMYAWSDADGVGTSISIANTSDSSDNISFSKNDEYLQYIANAGYLERSSNHVYPWSNSTGQGTRFSSPASGPRGSGRNAGFNRLSNVYWVYGSFDSNLGFYSLSPSGIGSQIGSNMTGTYGVRFNSTDTAIICTGTSGMRAFAWSNSTGVGTQFTAPASSFSFANNNYLASISPSDKSVAVGGNVIAWQNGVGWGTVYTSPTYPSTVRYSRFTS
jgi:hypothetical protein